MLVFKNGLLLKYYSSFQKDDKLHAQTRACSVPQIESLLIRKTPVLKRIQRAEARRELKRFLLQNLYQHPRVLRMTRKAEAVLADLYRVFRSQPALLPQAVRERTELETETRVIADYVAGMTDRFAMAEHRKLLDPHEPI